MARSISGAARPTEVRCLTGVPLPQPLEGVVSLRPNAARKANGNSSGSNGYSASSVREASISTAFIQQAVSRGRGSVIGRRREQRIGLGGLHSSASTTELPAAINHYCLAVVRFRRASPDFESPRRRGSPGALQRDSARRAFHSRPHPFARHQDGWRHFRKAVG